MPADVAPDWSQRNVLVLSIAASLVKLTARQNSNYIKTLEVHTTIHTEIDGHSAVLYILTITIIHSVTSAIPVFHPVLPDLICKIILTIFHGGIWRKG